MALEIVDFLAPRYIVLLGNTACESILRKKNITQIRGRWIENALPTFHPSYILRNPHLTPMFEGDIESVASKLQQTNMPPSRNQPHQDTPRTGSEFMSEAAKIKAISEKSENFGNELGLVRKYAEVDPTASIGKARKLLELMLSERLPDDTGNLNDKIHELSGILPSHIETQMHFIRKLGNTAIHSDENLNSQLAMQNFDMLLSIFCWNFEVDVDALMGDASINSEKVEVQSSISNPAKGTPENKPEGHARARFFIADEIYKTWPKIAVLTEDGTLYCEYLAWLKPTTLRKSGFDFIAFQAQDFSFGEGEHGNAYQSLREVSYQEATRFSLKRQDNWVKRYLTELGINPQD